MAPHSSLRTLGFQPPKHEGKGKMCYGRNEQETASFRCGDFFGLIPTNLPRLEKDMRIEGDSNARPSHE
eukprot:scaffold360_cov107-Cylindrotheca_fusiformis.AAC.9